MLAHSEPTDYVDPEIVRQEVVAARRLCTANRWPVIDVTRRSIEETAGHDHPDAGATTAATKPRSNHDAGNNRSKGGLPPP